MELKIGTALTLEPINSEKNEKYRCKVVEKDEHGIYIDYPINTITKKTAFLMDGAQFRATFMTDDKISYAFNTEVLGRKMGRIPTITLFCPPYEEFVKIQRREFVRIHTEVDVAVEYKNIYYQFVTEDISAGGLALILKNDVPFKEGENLKLTIVLPYSNGDLRYVRMEAIVIRIYESEGRKFASLQFSETEDLAKQFIVRFCFERQLLLHRKREV